MATYWPSGDLPHVEILHSASTPLYLWVCPSESDRDDSGHAYGHNTPQHVRTGTTISATGHLHGRTTPFDNNDDGQGSRHFVQNSHPRSRSPPFSFARFPRCFPSSVISLPFTEFWSFLQVVSPLLHIWPIQLCIIHYALHFSPPGLKILAHIISHCFFLPSLLTRHARVHNWRYSRYYLIFSACSSLTWYWHSHA